MPRTTKHLVKTQFKKGQSGNPQGGKLHNPIIKALKNLTVDTYREVIEVVLTGTLSDLEAIIKNPQTPVIQVGVARAFHRAMKDGDYAIIERIAERIVGKIPDVVNINSNNNNKTDLTVIDEQKLKAAMIKIQNDV